MYHFFFSWTCGMRRRGGVILYSKAYTQQDVQDGVGYSCIYGPHFVTFIFECLQIFTHAWAAFCYMHFQAFSNIHAFIACIWLHAFVSVSSIHAFIEGFSIRLDQNILYGIFIHKIPIAFIITASLLSTKIKKYKNRYY